MRFLKRRLVALTQEQELDFVKMVIGLNIDRLKTSDAALFLMARDDIAKLIVDGLHDPKVAGWYSR